MRPTPEQYAEFVRGLQLQSVKLTRGEMRADRDSVELQALKLDISDEASYQPADQGFEVRHSYTLDFNEREGGKACCGAISATFALRFTSERPLDDDTFEIFWHVNLAVNTWPYWREFVQSSLARMGWPTLTVPLLKQNAAIPPKPREQTAVKTSRKTSGTTGKKAG